MLEPLCMFSESGEINEEKHYGSHLTSLLKPFAQSASSNSAIPSQPR